MLHFSVDGNVTSPKSLELFPLQSFSLVLPRVTLQYGFFSPFARTL